MTREQATEKLKALGIAEPTKEQIDAYLNTMNAEVQKEKAISASLKEKAEKADNLQKQLDEINESKLTEAEKAQKQINDALEQNKALQKELSKLTMKNKLAEIGITGENAEKLFTDKGELDVSVLGQVLTTAKAEAATAKEAELAGKAGNPNGGSGEEAPDSDGAFYAKQFTAQYTNEN